MRDKYTKEDLIRIRTLALANGFTEIPRPATLGGTIFVRELFDAEEIHVLAPSSECVWFDIYHRDIHSSVRADTEGQSNADEETTLDDIAALIQEPHGVTWQQAAGLTPVDASH